MPYTNIIHEGFWPLGANYESPFYMFSGYVGYMILGYYLRTYELPTKKILPYILLFVLSLVPMAMVPLFANQHKFIVVNNLQILSALQVIAIFAVFKICFNKESILTKICQHLTNYTFGIYLIHTFVIWIIYSIVGGKEVYPAYISLPLVILASFIGSYCIVFVVAKVKYLKRLVGCR